LLLVAVLEGFQLAAAAAAAGYFITAPKLPKRQMERRLRQQFKVTRSQ
jgi:hypothetical protein